MSYHGVANGVHYQFLGAISGSCVVVGDQCPYQHPSWWECVADKFTKVLLLTDHTIHYIPNPTAGKCKENLKQCVHVHDSFTHELQTLNPEQKHAVDDITDNIIELQKVIALLQLTVDNTKQT